APLIEDRLTLIVHHVVVYEQVLADVEVARLDLGLRLLKRLIDPGMDDGLVLFQAERLKHAVHALRAENAHEVVFEREEEAGAAGIALPAGTAAQLIVDSPALVAFGANHVETAGLERRLFALGDFRHNVLALGGDLLRRWLLALLLLGGEPILGQHVGVAAELDVGAASSSAATPTC